MKKLRQILEKNYFANDYAVVEKSNNERGFTRLIHIIASKPKDGDYALSMTFPEMVEYLKKNPIDDLYFYGAPIMAYQLNWRFKLFVKNNNLERYFKDMPDEFIEEELLGI